MPEEAMLAGLVSVIGGASVLTVLARRFRRTDDLPSLENCALVDRKLKTVWTWLLLGGTIYTAYTFAAVPGLVYSDGASGFFALPYTVIVCPLAFFLLPRLWAVARQHGYRNARCRGARRGNPPAARARRGRRSAARRAPHVPVAGRTRFRSHDGGRAGPRRGDVDRGGIPVRAERLRRILPPHRHTQAPGASGSLAVTDRATRRGRLRLRRPRPGRHQPSTPRRCLDPADLAHRDRRAVHTVAPPTSPARRVGNGHGDRHRLGRYPGILFRGSFRPGRPTTWRSTPVSRLSCSTSWLPWSSLRRSTVSAHPAVRTPPLFRRV